MTKKILLLLASVFLIYQSVKMVSLLIDISDISCALYLFLAWLFNIFVTGIFAFAGFALPTQKLMPEAYYTVRNPALLSRVSTWMNVELFRKFLLATVWRNKDKRSGFFNGKKEGINNLIIQSQKSEFGHLWPLFILTVLSIYFILNVSICLGISTLIFNILGNLYPIILQRHHRMRVQRIMKGKQ